MSVRKEFTQMLYDEMTKDERIILVVGDLGWKQFDQHRLTYPDRFINVGAAEQLMVGAAVGMALEGMIPIVYSMTPFTLYRPFEWIRNHLDHDQIPVKLFGAGRNYDYDWLGFTHWAHDDKVHMSGFKNIKKYWPEDAADMRSKFNKIIYSDSPTYCNLSR
jgi:transketolase|tara:strand:- start:11054 stop:11536 length:483 start_codon:yes stop_codon:yes gene_type:complete